MAIPTVLPATQRAIIANEKLSYTISNNALVPAVSAGRVIIKTEAVGLNPVDTKMVGPFVTAGASYGVSAHDYDMSSDIADTMGADGLRWSCGRSLARN
jgi:hypothetical protein